MQDSDKSYCVKCKCKTGNTNCETKVTKNNRSYISANCSECNSKKSKFVKNTDNATSRGALIKDCNKFTRGGILNPADYALLNSITSGAGLTTNLKNIQYLILKPNGLVDYNFSIDELESLIKKIKIKGGILGIDDAIIGLIIGIISLIATLVGVISDQVNRAREEERYKKEEERRQQELKDSESKQKELDLKAKLMQYDKELGIMAMDANLSVKELCILQLKDDQSKVTAMKNSLLKDASKFNKTELEFVEYCIEIAENYLWWNAKDLLELMKAEIVQPGVIQKAAVHLNQNDFTTGAGLKKKHRQRTKSEIVL